MTRNVFKSYLRKIQKLQILAYEHGLNLSFGTRDAQSKKEGWITGHVYPEGCKFTEGTDGVDFIYFYLYDWREQSLWDEEIARIEKWILEHSVIKK